MLIDSHVHTFPFLGGPSGYRSAELHLKKLQRSVFRPINPVRRVRDGAEVQGQTLWNGHDHGPGGLTDVEFRVGRFGRLEWTVEGEDVYVQLFAPSLQEVAASADYLVAEMDYAGVDVAVLQNAGLYGVLNDFFADCARRYPGRFVPLAQVHESRAHHDEQLAELRRCATTLGMRGLFYSLTGFWTDGYRDQPDHPGYRPFWELVRSLDLVVFWDPYDVAVPSPDAYQDQLARMLRVLERHPGLRVVLVQAFPIQYYAPDGRYQLPDVARQLVYHPEVLLEIAYPISYGQRYEYPYRETLPLIQQLRDWFGAERLVWGSDMPNVLRFCTYRQAHGYLRHAEFLTAAERDQLLGGNLARLFRLWGERPVAATETER